MYLLGYRCALAQGSCGRQVSVSCTLGTGASTARSLREPGHEISRRCPNRPTSSLRYDRCSPNDAGLARLSGACEAPRTRQGQPAEALRQRLLVTDPQISFQSAASSGRTRQAWQLWPRLSATPLRCRLGSWAELAVSGALAHDAAVLTFQTSRCSDFTPKSADAPSSQSKHQAERGGFARLLAIPRAPVIRIGLWAGFPHAGATSERTRRFSPR